MSDRFKIILTKWIVPLGLEAIVILLVAQFVFFFAVVPTGSMIPTVDEGSYLFVSRVHNPEKLQRGDIVVFDSQELQIQMVKRLIGLPGETVVIDDAGQLYINGAWLDEPYVKNQSTQSGEFTVPEGCYFFLGDNRSNSNDARFWSNPYVDAAEINGKALFTLLPFDNFGVLE